MDIRIVILQFRDGISMLGSKQSVALKGVKGGPLTVQNIQRVKGLGFVVTHKGKNVLVPDSQVESAEIEFIGDGVQTLDEPEAQTEPAAPPPEPEVSAEEVAAAQEQLAAAQALLDRASKRPGAPQATPPIRRQPVLTPVDDLDDRSLDPEVREGVRYNRKTGQNYRVDPTPMPDVGKIRRTGAMAQEAPPEDEGEGVPGLEDPPRRDAAPAVMGGHRPHVKPLTTGG